MGIKELDNLIYTYNRQGRGTGKTTSVIDQTFRLAMEDKNVVVVSLNDSFAKQLSSLFSRKYTVFRHPRFVSVETFSSVDYQWDGYTVLVDPDVWVRLLQESISKPSEVKGNSRIQIIESETQPDGYAIAYDGDINGDDLVALLARTRKSERERIARLILENDK